MSQKTKAPLDPRILTSSLWNGWHTLPDFIYSDIMMMLGLESLEDLNKCRQVCQGWNGMLSKMTKLKKKTIMKTPKSVACGCRYQKEVLDKLLHIEPI